jgi:hypothetical protein
MKYIHLIIGGICLVFNLLVCLVFDAVGNHVLVITSLVVITTAVINHICGTLDIKDGYKVALPFFFTFNGLVEYGLSFFVDESLNNNSFLVAIIALFVIQLSVLIVSSLVSKVDTQQKPQQ